MTRSFIMLIALFLISCATPYEPAYGPTSDGYSDLSIGGDKWLVTFRGNQYTPEPTMTNFAYRRVREVCGRYSYETDFNIISVHHGGPYYGGYRDVQITFECFKKN